MNDKFCIKSPPTPYYKLLILCATKRFNNNLRLTQSLRRGFGWGIPYNPSGLQRQAEPCRANQRFWPTTPRYRCSRIAGSVATRLLTGGNVRFASRKFRSSQPATGEKTSSDVTFSPTRDICCFSLFRYIVYWQWYSFVVLFCNPMTVVPVKNSSFVFVCFDALNWQERVVFWCEIKEGWFLFFSFLVLVSKLWWSYGKRRLEEVGDKEKTR